MTRALVVWEDRYCEGLDVATRRLIRSRAVEPRADVPAIVRHTTRGNGAFERYVQSTWPKVRSNGLPVDPGPLDHLLCVVDGDRLHDLLAGVSRPPSSPDDVGPWHERAERAWQTHLRSCCDPSGPSPETVHGVVLRWSRESVALAGYDHPAAAPVLQLKAAADLAVVLRACTPDPRLVPDARFTETFHKPLECLRLLRGGRVLDKASPEIDDAIRALTRQSVAVLGARVPDLARIADLIWSLHASAA